MSRYRKLKRWAKRVSNRKIRRTNQYMTKGNHHHKNFDYWWFIT